MDKNSGRTKKTGGDPPRPDPASRARAGRGDAKPKRRAARRTGAVESAQNSEPMRVIEGGARKRAPDLKDHIGRQLKAVYDDVVRQPVPARLMELLHALDAKSKTDGS